MTRAFALLALATAAAIATPRLAYAQSPPTAGDKEASAWKAQGDGFMDDLRYAEALDMYTKAYDKTHDPALLYNRARAFGALHQNPEALAALERFAAEAPPEMKAKVPLDLKMAEFRRAVATITITCNVQGASILLRDKAIGSCPLDKPLQVNSGPATIVVSAVDYGTQKQDVVLPEGGTKAIDFTLVRSTAAVLVVRSTPAGADAKVDGRGVGATPLEVPVNAGTHKVVLSHSGYHDLQTSVVVEHGMDRLAPEPFQLSPKGVTSKAWFWTVVVVGVGLVAGAVAGTVYAFTTERSPDSGSILPGKISTGLSF